MSVPDVMLLEVITLQQESWQTMFDDVINTEAIDNLTPEQVEQILSILEKAGY